MRGSVTIFASLMIMLVSQFIFTFLEAGRNIEMQKVADMDSESVIESIFAQYCIPLWDEYRVLAYDAGQDGLVDIDQIEDFLKAQNKSNFNITTGALAGNSMSTLRLNLDEAEIKEYALLTDADAEVFRKQIVSYMQNNIAYEAAKTIYSNYSSINNIERESEYDGDKVDEAIDALKDKESSSSISEPGKYAMSSDIVRCTPVREESSDKDEDYISESLDEDNPLVSVSETKAKGVLSLIIGDKEVSTNTLDSDSCVSGRSLCSGTYMNTDDKNWYDDVLLNQYYLSYMSNYLEPNDNHAMKYELEYMVCGNNNDSDNLKGVVNRILLIRCAANIAYLISNPAKQSEALALATTIAGITVNPAIIAAVKYGLLIGWAYCESILDLRTIMDGEKVPIIKSDETWTSGLSGIKSLLSGDAKAKSSDMGVGYKGYIGAMLMFSNSSGVLYRTMDMQEATVRKCEGYNHFKMDNCVSSLNVDMKYSYNTIFISFVSLIYRKPGRFELTQPIGYSYY